MPVLPAENYLLVAFKEAVQGVIDPIDQFAVATVGEKQHEVRISSLAEFNINYLIVKSHHHIFCLQRPQINQSHILLSRYHYYLLLLLPGEYLHHSPISSFLYIPDPILPQLPEQQASLFSSEQHLLADNQ